MVSEFMIDPFKEVKYGTKQFTPFILLLLINFLMDCPSYLVILLIMSYAVS